MHEKWIENELLPKLLENGKFSTKLQKFSKIKHCEISRLSSAEVFMLTVCYRIKIIVTNDENNINKEFGFVLKVTPPCDESTYKAANFNTLFQNEVIAYTEMFPVLQWTGLLAKYYYSDIKEMEAKILLSDFTLDGYRMSKAKGNLSLEHIIASVKLIAEFHGISYALKHNNPTAFNAIKEKFKETRYQDDTFIGNFETVLHRGPVRGIMSVREHNNELQIPEEFLQTLEKILKNVIKYQKVKRLPVEPYAIFCHGDFLRNNVAFKYLDEKNDIPEKAIMFDFQTFRYASPMLDLTTFMANSTGIDVRSKYFTEIFNSYYTVLIDTYRSKIKSNQDLPNFLSYDSLLKEYVRYLPFAYSIASSFVALCLFPIADVMTVDYNSKEFVESMFVLGGETVNRELRSLVMDMYNFFTEHQLELS